MKFTLVIILTLLPLTAFAVIERIAIPNEKGMALYWWPKINIPTGWHQDKEQSYHYSSNAIAPDGYTFSDAETVMYARAEYKPRIPDVKSLEQFIENDKKDFLSHSPDIAIKEVQPLVTADGKSWRSFTFKPKDKGNWERVTYGEEGDFYLIFSISSRSVKNYESSEKVYENLIQSYKEK